MGFGEALALGLLQEGGQQLKGGYPPHLLPQPFAGKLRDQLLHKSEKINPILAEFIDAENVFSISLNNLSS